MDNLTTPVITLLSSHVEHQVVFELMASDAEPSDAIFHYHLAHEPDAEHFTILVISEQELQRQHLTPSLLKSLYHKMIVIAEVIDNLKLHQFYHLGFCSVLRHDFIDLELKILIKDLLHQYQHERTNGILEGLMASANNSIVITDTDGRFLFVNDHFTKTMGYSLKELTNVKQSPFASGYHTESFYEGLWNTLNSGQAWSGMFINRNKSGDLVYEDATITPLKNSNGTIERYMKIAKDITREQMLDQSLSAEVNSAVAFIQAFKPQSYQDKYLRFDFLTKAYNRVGGDLVVFQKISEGIYGCGIIDVMGHGFYSSMIGLVLSTQFKEAIMYRPLNDVVNSMNLFLSELNSNSQDLSNYVSGIFLKWDFNQSLFEMINAGHPDCLIKYTDGTITHRPSTGPLLGISSAIPYHACQQFNANIASVMLCTDGMLEVIDDDIDLALDLMHFLIEANDPWEQVNHYFKYLTVSKLLEDDVTLCLISALSPEPAAPA